MWVDYRRKRGFSVRSQAMMKCKSTVQSDKPWSSKWTIHTFYIFYTQKLTESKLIARPQACTIIMHDLFKLRRFNVIYNARSVCLPMTYCRPKGFWDMMWFSLSRRPFTTSRLFDTSALNVRYKTEIFQQTQGAETPDRIISVFIKVKINTAPYPIWHGCMFSISLKSCRLFFFVDLLGLNRVRKQQPYNISRSVAMVSVKVISFISLIKTHLRCLKKLFSCLPSIWRSKLKPSSGMMMIIFWWVRYEHPILI